MSYDDPRIKYFYASKHTLLYEARNHAIEQSKGEFIAFLDVDDWWESEKLESNFLTLRIKMWVWFVRITMFSMKVQGGPRPFMVRVMKPSGYILKDLLNDYHVGLLTILFRRSTYDSLGGFDLDTM